MNVTDLPRRMQAKIQVRESGCWEWIGARTGFNYGSFRTPEGNLGAHRVAYQLLVGPIPDGLQLDHLCRNKPCCNPSHLELVTSHENTLRKPGCNPVDPRIRIAFSR